MYKILLTTVITTGILFSASVHVPSSEEIENDYLKWEKNVDSNILKKSKEKKVFETQKRITAKTKRQELMDSQYKTWNESSLSKPDNREIEREDIIYSKNIDKNINTSLKLNYGKCTLINKLDKSTLLHGDCSLLVHSEYPEQYIYSFNNSRTFFFQKENNKWVLKQEKTEDSPAVLSGKSFSTSNYEISFK